LLRRERERLARYRTLGFHLRDGLGPALDRKPTVWLLGERTRVVRDLLLDRQHLFGRPNAIRNVCRPQHERRVLGEDPVAEPLDLADVDDPVDEVAVDVIPAEAAVRQRERSGDQARVAIDGRDERPLGGDLVGQDARIAKRGPQLVDHLGRQRCDLAFGEQPPGFGRELLAVLDPQRFELLIAHEALGVRGVGLGLLDLLVLPFAQPSSGDVAQLQAAGGVDLEGRSQARGRVRDVHGVRSRAGVLRALQHLAQSWLDPCLGVPLERSFAQRVVDVPRALEGNEPVLADLAAPGDALGNRRVPDKFLPVLGIVDDCQAAIVKQAHLHLDRARGAIHPGVDPLVIVRAQRLRVDAGSSHVHVEEQLPGVVVERVAVHGHDHRGVAESGLLIGAADRFERPIIGEVRDGGHARAPPIDVVPEREDFVVGWRFRALVGLVQRLHLDVGRRQRRDVEREHRGRSDAFADRRAPNRADAQVPALQALGNQGVMRGIADLPLGFLGAEFVAQDVARNTLRAAAVLGRCASLIHHSSMVPNRA
jgi:hypothetical protein